MAQKERFVLIDGTHHIFRAYHAIRGLSTSSGFPTNAIYGVANMLLKVIRDHKPDRIAVALDLPGPTFRDEIYPEYKANRPPVPDDLIAQIPKIREVIEAMGIGIIAKEGFEADDVIGTLATAAAREGHDVFIVTGDKDLFQLVGERVTVLDTMKDVVIDADEVKRRLDITDDTPARQRQDASRQGRVRPRIRREAKGAGCGGVGLRRLPARQALRQLLHRRPRDRSAGPLLAGVQVRHHGVAVLQHEPLPIPDQLDDSRPQVARRSVDHALLRPQQRRHAHPPVG